MPFDPTDVDSTPYGAPLVPVLPIRFRRTEILTVVYRTDRDAANDQFRPSLCEVARDKVQVVHPARRVSNEKLYRTCRSGRRELNDSEVGGGPVVHVEGEAGPLLVKRKRSVDIGDRQWDDLQLD